MITLLIYGPGKDNCKQTLVYLLLHCLNRYSLIETTETSLYTSVLYEPEKSRTGPYADSGVLYSIKIYAPKHELAESIEQGVQLAEDSDGLIIMGSEPEDYPAADFKIAVQDEGDYAELPEADFIYRMREDLDSLITEISA